MVVMVLVPLSDPSLPPVMNIPGAEWTQARHWTEAAAEGKQKDVMHANASLSTSRTPLWRLETVGHRELLVQILSLLQSDTLTRRF